MSKSSSPIDGSPPCSAVPGILQARTLEWVVIAINDYYIKRYICTYNFCSGFQNPGRAAGDGQDIALNHIDLCFVLVIDD